MKNSELANKFVTHVFQKIHHEKDKGYSAHLRKADSETTQMQSWEILARWVDLRKKNKVLALGVIGSAIAKSKQSTNGNLGLGEALAHCSNNKQKTTMIGRLRRILACNDSEELIRIIRSTINLINSKGLGLDYVSLLTDILTFDFEKAREKTLRRWANGFFAWKGEEV